MNFLKKIKEKIKSYRKKKLLIILCKIFMSGGAILIPIIFMDSIFFVLLYTVVILVAPYVIFKFLNSKDKNINEFLLFISFSFYMFAIWFNMFFLDLFKEIENKIQQMTNDGALLINFIDSFSNDWIRYILVGIIIISILYTSIISFIYYLRNYCKLYRYCKRLRKCKIK